MEHHRTSARGLCDRVGVAKVAVHHLEVARPIQVAARSVGKVVEPDHVVPGGQQACGEMGPDEPGGTGDENAHAAEPTRRRAFPATRCDVG